MDKKQIIFVIIGIAVVIYLINKLQPGETNVVSQIVPVGSIDSNGVDERALFEANKTNAFSVLANVAQGQQASEVQIKNIENQLNLETVRAQVQNNSIFENSKVQLGLADYASTVASKQAEYQYNLGQSALLTQKDIAAIEAQTEQMRDKYGFDATLAGYASAYQLQDLLSKTQIQGLTIQTEADREYTQTYFKNLLDTITLQNQAAKEQLDTKINTLNQVGNTYRNQSLERQGTILNAYSDLFTGNAPYNYVSAFGGPRPPTLLQQLTALAGTILPQGIGGFFGI